MRLIPYDNISLFIENAFLRSGVSGGDARICADILITSDLRGIESHGIGRLKMYIERIQKGLIEPVSKPQIIRESPTTALIDGNHGIGMVIGHQSMNIAIAKAKEFGMGAVAVRNSTHFGIDGYYPLMAVKSGMIGMSFTNARPSVAPTFSTQPVLGTNPIAFGAPSDEEFPFLFDAATSITQRGKIEVLNRKEKPVSEYWVIDNHGNPIQDADKILQSLLEKEAALLPLGGAGEVTGGHKGYGLSVIVEILSSSLQSGAFLSALSGFDEEGNETRFRVGHFFFALNIESFLPLEEFKGNLGTLLRELRSAKKSPGKERIYTAGEKEFLTEMQIKKGGIPVNENLENDLHQVEVFLDMRPFQFGKK